jgi:hypothetical protein
MGVHGATFLLFDCQDQSKAGANAGQYRAKCRARAFPERQRGSEKVLVETVDIS